MGKRREEETTQVTVDKSSEKRTDLSSNGNEQQRKNQLKQQWGREGRKKRPK
jgi:hypothetical protein